MKGAPWSSQLRGGRLELLDHLLNLLTFDISLYCLEKDGD